MTLTIHRWALTALVAGICSWPVTASAQNGRQTESQEEVHDEGNLLERGHDQYKKLREHGLRLSVGSILSGSGLAAGVEFGRDRLLGTPLSATLGAASSIRGYHMYEARLGKMKGREHMAELGPADSDLMSVFNDAALLVFGTAVYVHARERFYPRMDFFGLGQGTSREGRSDYGLTGSSVDLVVQWQRNRHFGLSGRVGNLDLRVRPGTNNGVPNIETLHGSTAAPGLDAEHRYRVMGVSATIDFRDAPHLTSEGTFAGVALWRGSPRDAGDATDAWSRLVTEVRHFVPLGSADRVLAFHALLSTRVGDTASPTPFFLQPTIGGSKTMRGFSSYRLRGDAVWTASTEYRWRVHRRVQVAPFVDIGDVADRFSSLGEGRVAVVPGIGVRAISHNKVIGRLDFARSRDGNRVVLTFSAPF
jgi:hypothetical protein